MSEATVTGQGPDRVLDCWKIPKYVVAHLLAEEIRVFPPFTKIKAAVWEQADLVDAFDRVRQEIRDFARSHSPTIEIVKRRFVKRSGRNGALGSKILYSRKATLQIGGWDYSSCLYSIF
jgi:hypothetical protein